VITEAFVATCYRVAVAVLVIAVALVVLVPAL